MTTKKKVFKIIKSTLYYGITFFLIFIISISLFMPNGLVKILGVGWYRVVSESMEPMIMTGDYIIVTRDQNVDQFKDGDVIIFETHFYNRQVQAYVRDVVTHHFYKIDDEGYVLTYPHSQYNLAPEDRKLDEWKSSESQIYRLKVTDVVGRHQTTIPMASVNHFLASPIGVSILVISIGLGIGLIILFIYDKKQPNELDQSEDVHEHDMENLD